MYAGWIALYICAKLDAGIAGSLGKEADAKAEEKAKAEAEAEAEAKAKAKAKEVEKVKIKHRNVIRLIIKIL